MPNSTYNFPFTFIGAQVFAWNTILIRPYSQKGLNAGQAVFNRWISTVRFAVENAFGLISSRFGVLGKPINLDPLNASILTFILLLFM